MTYDQAQINSIKEIDKNGFIIVSSENQHYVFVKTNKKPQYYFTVSNDGIYDLINTLIIAHSRG